jgi:hypothetical protein
LGEFENGTVVKTLEPKRGEVNEGVGRIASRRVS